MKRQQRYDRPKTNFILLIDYYEIILYNYANESENVCPYTFWVTHDIPNTYQQG